MKVLITGANGMVARAAVEHCRSLGDEVVGVTRQELDIADRDVVFRSLDTIRPKLVLNCAAYTDVDGAETNVDVSYAANSTGPENLAAATKEFESIFVTISTDYVFDGENDGFYTEDDKPNPQGVYAKSKLEGEVRAAAANPESIIVRSGWIYGHHGTNFLSVMHKLLSGGKKITAISDSFGTPTYAGDLVVRLRELAELKTSGVFHATNSGPGTSYLEFAKTVAEIGGYDPDLVGAVSKDSLQRPAPRPTSSKLACVRSEALGLSPVRDWREALMDFLSGK
jgi:dTDP-4-dehydrorhamnose reductase